ncbi:hypothetical protein ACCT03_11805 [Rhizobium johnstonii]|uniref:Uncharacterized protein n=2 Tax=Rhizobium TaxID=379 RepID=Q1M5C8_RHIJ3|nr:MULTISPECIES: hypothetical protein [Rhizobium]WSH11486.1 hypothetical protein U8P72_31740 [Rhizobium johnstonii]MBB4510095.1 hypothetical protein [Rhizobium leguminosarum]MBY5415543.1 hypothetical protein [Rhizobium leguminosarum]NEI90274.1 hypothetical protein [Rhizobium leguminosarum]NEJ79998.1 hypothetical protein [Rhizobium leguminosarum]
MTAPDPQSSNIGQNHIAKRAPSRHDDAHQSDPVGQYIKLYFFLFRKIQAPKAAPAPGDLVSAVI